MAETIVGIGGIIIGLLAAYVFHRLEKKECRPVYVLTGNVVVRADETREIEVRHSGKVVPVVTRTVIAFWNAGREPIRRTDVVEGHPVAVSPKDHDAVLDARVLALTRPEIDFDIDFAYPTPDGNMEVLLRFSYLNYRDGGAVEILHTNDHPGAVAVLGAIVGVDGPPSRIESPLWNDPVGYRLGFGTAAVFFGMGMLLLAGKWAGTKVGEELWFLGLLPLLLSPFAFLTGWRSWRRDRRRVPEPLRDVLGAPAVRPGSPNAPTVKVGLTDEPADQATQHHK